MNRLFSLLSAAAVLSTSMSLQAQTINVTITGWTAVPVVGFAAVPFNGASTTGAVNGNSTVQIGTTLGGGTTTATGFFTGTNTGGVSVGGGSSATISGTENYTLTLGGGSGHVTSTITVAPNGASGIVRNGPGHRGAANSNVTVSLPGAGSIAATVQIRDVSGQPPLLMTLPVTANTGFFTTSTSLTMSASADATGTVGNGNLTMNAQCDANGQVTLQ